MVGWIVERDAQSDSDVPAGHADFFDEQAEQALFGLEVEGVDDGEDAGGEVVDAAVELVVAGEFDALGGERLASLS